MLKPTLILILLLQCLSLSAQRNYDMFALEEYKSDTVYMENYAYVCDTVAVFDVVNIYNLGNHPGRDIPQRKTGDPLSLDELFGFDIEHVLIPTELNNKMGAIIDNAFSEEQAASLNGKKFWVILNISSSTGEITDVYFEYDIASGYISIPLSVFRAIELQLKEQIVFELTEEGRNMNYCYLAWMQCPTGYVAPTLDPDMPFDGSGSGGGGNVQTGPRGSIITEPMVPIK